MILWDGLAMHDPPATEKCWGDSDGKECDEPATLHGLCGDCLLRLGGERPAVVSMTAP